MYDKQIVDALVSALREAAPSDSVAGVTGEFAGYFDELGITVSLKDDVSDKEIREVKNKILPIFDAFTIPSPWMVGFHRRGKLAATLFPSGLFTGIRRESPSF